MRPVIIDLFCKAGGMSRGFHDVGFEPVGVDINPQPNYPYRFIRANVLHLWEWLAEVGPFVSVHASPPCQAHSTQTQHRDRHVDLIPHTRQLLRSFGVPYIIENVEGARRHLVDPIRLCGSSFGLDVRRHRYFETNWPLQGKPCDHAWQTPRFRSLAIDNHREGKLATVVGVHGHLNYPGEFPIRCKAMEIDWMTNDELVEAIPPRYAEFIGGQLMEHLA